MDAVVRRGSHDIENELRTSFGALEGDVLARLEAKRAALERPFQVGMTTATAAK
jgi:hypothetical protein